MKYQLVKKVIDLTAEFESYNQTHLKYENSIEGFKQWILDQSNHNIQETIEPIWEGKENGRSPESIINTLIVHMNRYAKSYSKSAIYGSKFSTQEDFIYLINLKAFGEMTKIELIKKNIHEKPVGMQIINRLIKNGWVEQKNSEHDKRSKVIKITAEGLEHLEEYMHKIRSATSIVTGNLKHAEKMELIRLLNKLNDFHQPIYAKNLDPSTLLETVKNDLKIK